MQKETKSDPTTKHHGLILMFAALGLLLAAGGVFWLYGYVDKKLLSNPPTFVEVQEIIDQGPESNYEASKQWCNAYLKTHARHAVLPQCLQDEEGRRYKDIEALGQTQFVTLLTSKLKGCRQKVTCAASLYDSTKKLVTGAEKGDDQLPDKLQAPFDAYIVSHTTACTKDCEPMALKLLKEGTQLGDHGPTHKALATHIAARWAPQHDKIPLAVYPIVAAVRQLDTFLVSVRATFDQLPAKHQVRIKHDPKLAGIHTGTLVARTMLGQIPFIGAPVSYVRESEGWSNVSLEGKDGATLHVLLGKQSIPMMALKTDKTHKEKIVGAMNLLRPASPTLSSDEAEAAFLSRVAASSKDVTVKGSLLATQDFEPTTQAMLATWAANHIAMRDALTVRIDTHLALTKDPERSIYRDEMLSSFDTSYYSFVFTKHFARGVLLTNLNNYRASDNVGHTSGVGYVPSNGRSMRSYRSTSTGRSGSSSGGYSSGKN